MGLESKPVMWSFAQNFEDVMLERVFSGIPDGFYVDVGAWHPEHDSVTHHFYERGWRGINIEPNPHYQHLLKAQRTRDCNLGIAVGARSGRARLTVVHGTGMSTLDSDIAASLPDERFEKEAVDVRIRPLNDVFADYAPPTVHFLKIDCEGAETDVVTAFDVARFRPWIIIVEATKPLSCEPSHDGWEPHLLAGGYDFAYFDGVNRFYVAREHAGLAAHLRIPPNIFDNFIVARMAGCARYHPARPDTGVWRERVQRLFRRAA